MNMHWNHQQIKHWLPDYGKVLKKEVLPFCLDATPLSNVFPFHRTLSDGLLTILWHYLLDHLFKRNQFHIGPVRKQGLCSLYNKLVWVCFSYSFLKYHFISDSSWNIQLKVGRRKEGVKDTCQLDRGNKGHVQAKCAGTLLKLKLMWMWGWFFLQMHLESAGPACVCSRADSS